VKHRDITKSNNLPSVQVCHLCENSQKMRAQPCSPSRSPPGSINHDHQLYLLVICWEIAGLNSENIIAIYGFLDRYHGFAIRRILDVSFVQFNVDQTANLPGEQTV
jgi:hypothetical protein